MLVEYYFNHEIFALFRVISRHNKILRAFWRSRAPSVFDFYNDGNLEFAGLALLAASRQLCALQKFDHMA